MLLPRPFVPIAVTFALTWLPLPGVALEEPLTQPSQAAGRAVWQWSVLVPTRPSPETGEPPRAFLWIPPECRRVRAVIVGQHNMEEEGILEHPAFRKTLASLGVAAIWVTPAFDPVYRADQGATDTFNAMMAALAQHSGYAELQYSPIVPIGHSAAASFPWNFASANPSRTLAAISISGQWPFWRDKGAIMADPSPPPQALDGVPGIVCLGEYEWAETRAADGLKLRHANPSLPLSMLSEPGGGHFDISEEKVALLALYLQKAVQYRMPPESPPGQPPLLRRIDPTREGWLIEQWRRDTPPTAPAAPVSQYQGDPQKTFWCFDEEMAHAIVALGARDRGKDVALTGYVQGGTIVPQVDGTHQQVSIPFQPDEQGDGLTFKLSGTFLSTVPKGRPERWTCRKEGTPAGKPDDDTPVVISRICGPVERLSADTFAVRFYRMGVNNLNRSRDIWLAATHPGDQGYRRSVQQALLRIPLRNTDGTPQRLTFPPLADQPEGTATLPLQATSDAGAPVQYYVLDGPAYVAGSTLHFTPIPPRARFPLRVTVVAWQWGRTFEPRLQTAEPVTQLFHLTRPPQASP